MQVFSNNVMEEKNAIIGILLIAAISITAFFVIAPGQTGLAAKQDYLSCCCNILAEDNTILVRSQIQAFATRTTPDCQTICEYNYAGQGKIFSQVGLCTENP